MAETILFGLVDKMIWRLGSSVVQQMGIVWNVMDELERIQNTVSAIKAVVMDAEEQGATNHAVKHWLEKLKDAVDDADDLLDDFSTKALRREIMASEKKKSNKVRNFFSKSNPVTHDFKMGHRIKKIRKRLDAIAEDRLKFNFTGLTTVTRVKNREREQTHSFVREEEVIGRQEEKADLIKLLGDTTVEDNVSVIPIVGIGGLGKTTLAQFVYNDAFIQSHFELKKWVCMSDNDFDVKNIVGKIVESPSSEMEQLQQNLRTNIMGKRYLLVLDDVWDKNLSRERWLKLKSLLLDGAKGSKVIVTSRSEKVAKITGTATTFHLQGLDEKKSWILFSSLAFEKGEEPKNQEDLVAIGKEIVKKCSGVPLAVRSIGSLLYCKSSENDWLYFKENDLAKMNPEDNSIIPILQVSYGHLPYDLKNCFAYCSIFPKDYIIEKNKLIQLWMAQGFIQPLDENRSLEDVGDEYFMNLYWRSFFQDVKRDKNGDISACKMHDLIHDLAQFVAGNECSNIADGQERKNISNRTRHVSFGHELPSPWKVPTWLVKANKLRTFLLCTSYYVDLMVLDCHSLISSFKFLRALDLRFSSIKALPNSIGLLKHLRYLDLSCNGKIEILPTSITSLHNLQTLKLSGCWNLKELPTDIFAKLISLRHLGLNCCDKLTYVPYGLGRLTSFRTLTTFVVADVNNVSSSCVLSELSQLNNLSGSLELRGLKYSTEEGEVAKLQDKRLLNSLALNWDRSFDTPPTAVVAAKDELLLEGLQPHPKIKSLNVRRFGGVKFSAWLSSLSNLVDLRITYCSELQHLPPLHQLPHLEHLQLSNLRSLEYVDSRDNESDWSSSSSSSSSPLFFPSLKVLELEGMDKLGGWWKWSEVTSEAQYQLMVLPRFPCLSELYIGYCPNLTSLPLCPYIQWLEFASISVKMLRQLLKPPATTTTTADRSQVYTILQSSSSSSSSHQSPFSRLRSLSICSMEDLENFPDELLPSLTTLQDLFICDCNNLASLPEWIGKLPLQFTHIQSCYKLPSLPEGMRDIKTLRKLRITGSSSQIKERCKKDEGEDWPKIAHVQYCSID